MMPITVKAIAVFHCKCVRCAHEWDVRKKPKRCPSCKVRSWNGEDHRLINAYKNVPVASQIEAGTEAPHAPSYEAMLETLIRAGRIISEVIEQNPCDHSVAACSCADKAALAEINQQVEKLRALLPRRSTYLVK